MVTSYVAICFYEKIWNYKNYVYENLLSQENQTFYETFYIRIAGFCHEDFNVASHGICNIKIHYIFYLVTLSCEIL